MKLNTGMHSTIHLIFLEEVPFSVSSSTKRVAPAELCWRIEGRWRRSLKKNQGMIDVSKQATARRQGGYGAGSGDTGNEGGTDGGTGGEWDGKGDGSGKGGGKRENGRGVRRIEGCQEAGRGGG